MATPLREEDLNERRVNLWQQFTRVAQPVCSTNLFDDHINSSTDYGTASEHTYRGEDEDLLVFDDVEDNIEVWDNNRLQQDSSDEAEGVLYFSVDALMRESNDDTIEPSCSKQIELGDGFILEFMDSSDDEEGKKCGHDQQHVVMPNYGCSSGTCEYSITIEFDEENEFNSQPSWLLEDILNNPFMIKYTKEEMLKMQANVESYYHKDGLAAGSLIYGLIAKGKEEAKAVRPKRNSNYQPRRRGHEDTESYGENGEGNITKAIVPCVPIRQPKNPDNDEQQAGFYCDADGKDKNTEQKNVLYINCSICLEVVVN
ncbi:hypothetical protein G6F70_000235 [Rhizopus microsporus]|nr:hypothetical protein G6F71_003337 [Rhizopus microsporus]KAG1204783.1 hypothetical protein G6F70_000235 [Rhizopus microsporus]KAG1210880.1 hypothetical protein G6F69_005099 [Rhizopus microsporus]KAG1238193.1 hypothetical protein G6F67_000656 [Rhizopus microsporus]